MNRRARRRALVVVASTAVAGLGLMVPAYAASSSHSPAAPHGNYAGAPGSRHSGGTGAGTAPAKRTPSGAFLRSGGPASHLARPHAAQGGTREATSSENWSGYAATGGPFTSVSSSWVEPTGTCSSGNQYSSFWVGLDGYSSSSVEQTGSEVDCSGSTPQYYSWYEMYPANPVNFTNTVRPGDHFTGSVTYAGSNSFTLRLSDTTQGWSHTVTKTLAGAARSSAEVIAEAPCCTSSGGILPLADFGTVNFTGATANGSPIGTFSPTQIDMVSAKGVQEDSVSALSGGENFSATWLSSGSPGRGGGRGGHGGHGGHGHGG